VPYALPAQGNPEIGATAELDSAGQMLYCVMLGVEIPPVTTILLSHATMGWHIACFINPTGGQQRETSVQAIISYSSADSRSRIRCVQWKNEELRSFAGRS
jgi:hypothetical protein